MLAQLRDGDVLVVWKLDRLARSARDLLETMEPIRDAGPLPVFIRAGMMYPVRQSVRVVLLNARHEVLLMCMDDPRIRSVGESYKGRFWTLIGGRIEHNETVLEAAAREIFEETGISKAEIEFGPVVWFEELDLVTRDGPARVKQQFVVGRTTTSALTLAHLTEDEPEVVKRIAWFSLEDLRTSTETIYPVLLPLHLPRIITGDYPDQPLDVSKPPEEQVS